MYTIVEGKELRRVTTHSSGRGLHLMDCLMRWLLLSLYDVTRGTRHLTAFTLLYGLSLQTQLTDSLPIIGTTIVTSGMTMCIYSYVLLPEISYMSN